MAERKAQGEINLSEVVAGNNGPDKIEHFPK